MYKNRIENLFDELRNTNLDSVIISDPYNIFFLTGFKIVHPDDREAMIYCTRENLYILTPKMYQAVGDGLEVTKNSNVSLIYLKKGIGYFQTIKELLKQGDLVGFEEYDLKVSEFNGMKKTLECEVEEINDLVVQLRDKKDEDALEKIKKAVEITDLTFNSLVEFLRKNDYQKYTELDLVDELRKTSREYEGEGFGFDPVVASGKGSSEPHYLPSNKYLKEGEILLLDIGMKYQGYSGDLTRCVGLGSVDPKVNEIYAKVLSCNQQILKMCKPGIKMMDLHDKSIEIFSKEGLEDNYLHSIGHGLGLEIHGRPFVSYGKEFILEENMVITIEPGLYFKDKFGIRIEDVVVLKENGVKILTDQSTKELIQI